MNESDIRTYEDALQFLGVHGFDDGHGTHIVPDGEGWAEAFETARRRESDLHDFKTPDQILAAARFDVKFYKLTNDWLNR